MNNLAPGDIIQVTNKRSPLYPALLIVKHVKPDQVMAYALVPNNLPGTGWGEVYHCVKAGDLDKVGTATVVTKGWHG